MEPKGNSMDIDDNNPQLNLERSAVSLLDNKAKLSLYKKSSETGIPINVLEEVFMRGFSSWDGDFGRSPVQLGFNRVNSFVAGGYAARLDEDLKKACWKGYEAVGMKEKNGKKVPNCVPVKEGIVDNPMRKPELTNKISKGLGDINNRGIGQAIARGFGKNAPQPIQNMKNPMKEESTDLDEKLNLKKAAQLAGVAASLAVDAHHLHKNPHDIGYAAPAALSYMTPGASVAKSMIPAALKVDKAGAGEDEHARQKKYAVVNKKLKEESKLLNKPTLSDKQISNKFNVPVSKVDKAIEQGTKVEREHTKSGKLAQEIARDHLGERPDYYKKLAKMEKSPVKEEEYPTTKTRLLDGTAARTDWLKASTPGQSSVTKTIKKVVKESLVDGDHNV